MVVTVSHNGYIKRVPLNAYRAQRRGGKGRAGMSTRDEDFVGQVFVVNTHTPVLFFSSRGIVYKEKVYRLPLGTPQARGKAMVNLLPLDEKEVITTLMPLPEDEECWGDLHVMFATASGNVRRNRLSDFSNVMANGKIAMKLNEGDRLIGVQTCSEDDDILLATRRGKCIRFSVTDVRVFSGRNSTGNRGIRLAEDDAVISMSVLRHADIDTGERTAYLRQASALRRGTEEEAEAEETIEAEEVTEDGTEDSTENGAVALTPERFSELEAGEQFLLTIADTGFGKRSSTYGYRVTRRGGKGIELMKFGSADALVAAAFTVSPEDQIMLVTDGGKLIRTPVADIRIAGRSTRGVTVFRIAEKERVVSVAHLMDLGENGGENGAEDGGEDGAEDGDYNGGEDGDEGLARGGSGNGADGANGSGGDLDDVGDPDDVGDENERGTGASEAETDD